MQVRPSVWSIQVSTKLAVVITIASCPSHSEETYHVDRWVPDRFDNSAMGITVQFCGTVPPELLSVNRERVDKERQSEMRAGLTFAMMHIRHIDG